MSNRRVLLIWALLLAGIVCLAQQTPTRAYWQSRDSNYNLTSGINNIAFDGTPQHATGTNTAIQTASGITTSNSNIVLIGIVEGNGAPILTPSDTAGNTWNLIGTGGSNASRIAAYYAVSASALAADKFTGNQTSSSFMSLDFFALSGANTSSPLDASSPATGNVDPIALSTASAFTIGVTGFRVSTPSPTAGACCTTVTNSGANFLLSEYKLFSAAQTAFSFNVGTGVGGANGAIAFAIVSK